MTVAIRAALACAALVVVAACERASEPVVEIQLPRQKPQQGDTVVAVEDVGIELTFRTGGKDVEMTSRRHLEMLVKAMAVDGYAVTAAEVTYKDIRESLETDGKGEMLPDSRVGKTYAVFREDGVPVARPTRSAFDERELLEVADDNEGIGLPDEVDAVIAEKIWKTGQTITFTPDELARVNVPRGRPDAERKTLTEMQLTLRSVRDGLARFSVVMGLRYEGATRSVTVRLRGETRIEIATGHVLELKTRGEMKGTMDGVPANGTMTWTLLMRWVASP